MILSQKWQKVIEQKEPTDIWFNKLNLKYIKYIKKTYFTFALKYEETFSLTQYFIVFIMCVFSIMNHFFIKIFY